MTNGPLSSFLATLSPLQRNLVLILAEKIKQSDDDETVFRFVISDLTDGIETDGIEPRENFEKAVNQLKSREIILDQKKTKKSLRLIASAEIFEEGEMEIEVSSKFASFIRSSL